MSILKTSSFFFLVMVAVLYHLCVYIPIFFVNIPNFLIVRIFQEPLPRPRLLIER